MGLRAGIKGRYPEILRFIRLFDGAKDVFLCGCCYYFTVILKERFGGETVYDPVENHFMQEIGGHLFDVRGDVSGLYSDRSVYYWNMYRAIEPLDWGRVFRYCILKTEVE